MEHAPRLILVPSALVSAGKQSMVQSLPLATNRACSATNRKQVPNGWVPVPWPAEGVAGGRPDSFLPACPLASAARKHRFPGCKKIAAPHSWLGQPLGRVQTGNLGPRLVAPVFFFFLLSPVLHPSVLINLAFAAWERRDFQPHKRVRSN